MRDHILVIDLDGFNVGLKIGFSSTFLEFDDEQEAIDIANHWDNWIKGLDV